MAGPALEVGPWRTALRVEVAPEVRDELRARAERSPPPRSVWVTDLVDPRTAYWRQTAPLPPSPERAAVMAEGRELHHRIEAALAAPRFREVRRVQDGIVGQVDMAEDVPTEIKTTRPLPALADLAETRASYFEQLAMYCALLDSPRGRLLLVDGSDPAEPGVAVVDCRFEPLTAVREAMRRRAAQLRSALERRDPAELPACPWFGRGCEYRAAKVCTCRGLEPPPDTEVRATLREMVPRPDEGEAIARKLVATFTRPSVDPVRRFKDLTFPRRAYFERTQPPAEGTAGPAWVPGTDRLYAQLSEVLEAGPAGESTRATPPGGEPEEAVACFRGDPVLLRTRRSGSVTPASELPTAAPQYFLDLAFRCAALERPDGWLVLGYERAPTWEDRIRVYRVHFDPFGPIVAFARSRADALRSAVERRDPAELPSCPEWMYANCPYAPGCACGAGPAPRSNR